MTDSRVVLWGLAGVLLGDPADGSGEPASGQRTAGSAETMTALKLKGVTTMTLLTDMSAADATRAVGAIGVDRYLDLEVGGYGPTDREQLPAAVLERIQDGYGSGGVAATLITSSAADAAAAVRSGIRVVGISPTEHGRQRLRDAGAEAVFGDLTDVTAVVDAAVANETVSSNGI